MYGMPVSLRVSCRLINPPSTIVSPSEASTVVCTVCWLNTAAWMPPTLTEPGWTLDTVGSTRISTLPSGFTRGVTWSVIPMST